jgi:hypothetical protein
MIALYRSAGRWMENDAYIPKPGDIIFYDWEDSGSGDNQGVADHVGIVSSVSGNVINVVEGNYSDMVTTTAQRVNGKCIRGYGLPDYAAKADDEPLPEPEPEDPVPDSPEDPDDGFCSVKLPVLLIGDANGYVRAAQTLLIARGYDCGNKPFVGTEKADGEFGRMTERAVGFFQSKAHLEDIDGVIGPDTWAALLKF